MFAAASTRVTLTPQGSVPGRVRAAAFSLDVLGGVVKVWSRVELAHLGPDLGEHQITIGPPCRSSTA